MDSSKFKLIDTNDSKWDELYGVVCEISGWQVGGYECFAVSKLEDYVQSRICSISNPAPTDKARELVLKLVRLFGSAHSGSAMKEKTVDEAFEESITLIQSALTQAREEATKEAADRALKYYCSSCLDYRYDGSCLCDMVKPFKAAILGERSAKK